jgi:hypothetical protein
VTKRHSIKIIFLVKKFEQQIQFSPPTDYADIRSYIVYFNDSFARQAVHRVIQPPTNNYILEELIPDTVYHIQVSATSNRGEGAKS